MQITAAECAASNLQDDITRLDDLGPGSFDDFNLVLALPHQCLHLVGVVSGSLIVGDILLRDGGAIVPNGLFGLVSRL